MAVLRVYSAPLLVMFLAMLTGCSPSTGRVERGLEGELQELLGPADDYDVQIKGLRARSGEADQVVVVGQRVQMEGAPVLDRLEADLHGVQYDRDQERLERIDSARATAYVEAVDLADYLEESPNLDDVSVVLQPPDLASIQARPTVSGFSLPGTVEIAGRLRTEAGTVQYEVTEVRAAGVDAGDAVARRLSEAINPVLDLRDTPLGLEVTSIRVEGGALRLDGTGEVGEGEF